MTSQGAHGTKSSTYTVGARVKLLVEDMDNDEHGLERKIPAGTCGIITSVDESPSVGFHYHVEFDKGGWLIFYPDELPSCLKLI